MFLGRVVGTVWATKKEESLQGLKFQIVKKVDEQLRLKSDFAIAVDAVGAGPGELVLCASGSSARLTSATHEKPVDTVIMAIVDQVDFPEA
jgi:microcompartment protein CcmK/EutM